LPSLEVTKKRYRNRSATPIAETRSATRWEGQDVSEAMRDAASLVQLSSDYAVEAKNNGH